MTSVPILTTGMLRRRVFARGISALAFPGQGMQRQGLLTEMLRKLPRTTQPILDECDEALGERFSQALVGEHSSYNTTLSENAQPLLLVYGYCMFRHLPEDCKASVKYTLGHSLGEYTAWTAGGMLSLGDAVKLVRERGRAMQKAADEHPVATCMTMVVLREPLDEALARLAPLLEGENVWHAITNSDSQIVLSGEQDAITRVVKSLSSRRLVTRRLDVSGPFHSQIMVPAKDRLKQLVPTIDFQWPGKHTVISNRTGAPFGSLSEVKESVAGTLTSPVQWLQSIRYLEPRVDMFHQIGSGKYVGQCTSHPVTVHE